MTVKTNGAEFKRFYSDAEFWPDDNGETWYEEEEITVNGEEIGECAIEDIADTATVTVRGGIVYSTRWEDSRAPTFENYFKRWKKKQLTDTVILSIDISKLPTVMEMLKEFGVKVIK